MQKFRNKIIGFLIFPLLFFGVNMVINYLMYTHQSVPKQKINVLIAGDSHPQKSLNPEYFINAKNISQSAEPYVLTYWKLKNIIDWYNPDTLILGFAPHNISAFNDLKFSNEKWSREMFKRSYPIEDFSNISDLIPFDYSTYYNVLWKQTAFYPKKNHISYIGKYSNYNRNNISDSRSAAERHYYNHSKELGVSVLSVHYLDSIIHLCHSKNIEIVLVSHPVHYKYLKQIPAQILNKFDTLVQQYKKRHVVFDLTRKKYPDYLFLNCDHLNAKGAKLFTRELINHLNKKDLTLNSHQK